VYFHFPDAAAPMIRAEMLGVQGFTITLWKERKEMRVSGLGIPQRLTIVLESIAPYIILERDEYSNFYVAAE